ncbi:MAG: spherulation-specific family 4 protein, partial [Nitrososphaerota archaeon]
MLEVEIKNFTVNTSTISYLQNSQSNPIKRVITSLIPPNKNKFVFVQKFYRFCLDNNNDRQVYFYFQNEYEELKENNTNNTLVLIEIDTNDGVKKLLEFTITNSREFRLADRYVIKFTTDTKISYLQTCITLNNQSSSDGNNNTTVTNYVQDYIPINFSENTYEKENSIILPFYIYPYDYEKNDFVDDVKKLINKINSTQVPFYIIINPNSGLGDSEDSKYTEFIRMVISAGGYPIGYIPTGYGNRSISDIKSDIDKWKQLYPDVHGIFFDEVSTNVTKDYVKDICGY